MPKLHRKRGSIVSFNEQYLQQNMAICGLHLDEALGPLEESRFKKKHADLIRKLSKELHFTYSEVESIVLIYYKFQKQEGNTSGQMTRMQFREFLHKAFDMTDNKTTDIVVYVLDKNASQNVSLEAWVRALSLFLRGTHEEKTQLCFNAYDMMDTGIVPRDKMLHLMGGSLLGDDDSDDAIRDLFEIIANKMDKDRDGKISFQDFQEAVQEEPLMMEAFGPCLPSRLAIHAFRTTFTQYSGKHY